MSAALACESVLPAAPILPRIRATGADAVMRDGRPVLQNVSRMGSDLLAEVKARRDDLVAELTGEVGAVIVSCSRCGAASRPFAEVVNPEGWLCDGCWPAHPDDAAHDQTERAAIVAEGDASAPVLHAMPVSWSDASLIPTAGARCRNCGGNAWWCERDTPRGWRCAQCHPADHLPPAAVRVVMT